MMQTLATTNNVPLVDPWGRFNQTWQTNFMFDTLHPNDYGYQDVEGAVFQILNKVQ
jgi:hypothetical protein